MKIHVAMVVTAALMLPAPACEAGEWETDFEKASRAAKASGKHMLLDFSGSDWCGWCMRLDKEVFSQDTFKDYAKKYLVLVNLDFPRKKKLSEELRKQNDALAKKYRVRGYPTVLLLSPDGKLVGRTGYQPGGPEAYVKHLAEMISQGKSAGE
jgi:thioredoxin-related protein